MSETALSQLLEMGIPRSRALAALNKTKGDVMSAAERVFGGDFDDIPEDDDVEMLPAKENALKRALSSGEGAMSSETATAKRSGGPPPDDDDGEDMEGNDDDQSMSGGDLGEGDDADFVFDDEDDGEGRLLSDPYAGIFFSSDRIEKIMEPISEEEFVELDGKSVRVLSRSEWMSGCPEGNEQSLLFQSFSALTEDSMACSEGCGYHLPRKKTDFFAMFSEFSEYTTHVSNIIRHRCPRCDTVTCLACGDKVGAIGRNHDFGQSKEKRKQPSDGEVDALFHCPDVQGVLVGVGLHMIERAFAEPKKRAVNQSAPVKSPIQSAKGLLQKLTASNNAEDDDSDNEDDSVPFNLGKSSTQSGEAKKGTGYSGNATEDRSGQVAAQREQKRADERTALLLSQVQVYLPSLRRESGTRTSDHLVHPTALAHLRRRSAFVNDLLRNDSLVDMSSRGELYRGLFDWLEVVSNHEALAGMLAMPQMRPTKIEPSPNDDNRLPGKTLTITYEATSSPRELLENCVIQAQAALKGLKATAAQDEAKDEEEEEQEKKQNIFEMAAKLEELGAEEKDENTLLLEFCERIVASAEAIDRSLAEVKGKSFVERMKETLPRLPDSENTLSDVKLSDENDDDILKLYEDWATKARFQYCVTSAKEYKHAFNMEIKALESSIDESVPRRSLAIAKELAILTTSLPAAWHSSIFLRVDETRVDCIKAMIIGPEGTPYQNGCFVFDIFLPLEYNHVSPLVKTMTTNGGLYRYNPNLYADGKVCLSLLGTWSGPGWISGQSTLLQVLISLQSLILCEEPYLNEPGWSSMAGSAQSIAYSANVRRMVIADAMVNNIKNPPFPFEREIKTHFRLKSKAIKAQLETWQAEDDGHSISAEGTFSRVSTTSKVGSTSITAFKKATNELRELLNGLNGDDMNSS